MAKPAPEVLEKILELLQNGPMLQKDLWYHPPLNQLYDVGPAVRELVKAGLVTKEKSGSTYLLTLKEEEHA